MVEGPSATKRVPDMHTHRASIVQDTAHGHDLSDTNNAKLENTLFSFPISTRIALCQ